MLYPALKVVGVDGGLVMAAVDDCAPSAVDEHSSHSLTLFFQSVAARDDAKDRVARAFPLAVVSSLEVDDDDWARRSQENLTAVTVGRITVAPPWAITESSSPAAVPSSSSLTVVILPSMGFGTGHHATTRLCLRALQAIDLCGRALVDVGTGSGVLAIAARLLGARACRGIDNDPDAVRAAVDNLARNPGASGVSFEVAELGEAVRLQMDADVITANLTGSALSRYAGVLQALILPGGLLIVSGLLSPERGDVLAAFDQCRVSWEEEEDGWLGMVLRRDPT